MLECVSSVAEFAKTAGVLRPRDLASVGLAREYLKRAVEEGFVVQSAPGLYIAANAPVTEFHTLAQAAKRVPKGVICLLSALRFHDLGTQNPFAVWMAIGESDRSPVSNLPKLRIVRFSKASLHFGVEHHSIEGVSAQVSSIAKTIADCFKYRNKIGLDVALEALKDTLRNRRTTVNELWEAARVCRVANVMKPYMEALL